MVYPSDDERQPMTASKPGRKEKKKGQSGKPVSSTIAEVEESSTNPEVEETFLQEFPVAESSETFDRFVQFQDSGVRT